MKDLHKIQMLILRELLFKPNSTFTKLNIQGLTSDHFSYHINTLIKDGYVKKEKQKYSLTNKGKEFANQMDTEEVIMEKQPKVGVIVVGIKENQNEKMLLIQERTKEPYYGYKGFITGKVRFGEKVLETAKRELFEEAGLTCNELHLKTIVHNLVVLEESGDLIEDKMFYIVTAINPKGKLINTRNGKNYWITEKEFFELDKKYYDEDNMYKYSQIKEDMDLDEQVFFIKEF